MTPAAVIRGVVDEYNTYTPDEIADKLVAEGMLWCDRNPQANRATNCPMHHLFMARLEDSGFAPERPGDVTVGAITVWVDSNLETSEINYGPGSPITDFIDAFDKDEYDHLESGP